MLYNRKVAAYGRHDVDGLGSRDEHLGLGVRGVVGREVRLDVEVLGRGEGKGLKLQLPKGGGGEGRQARARAQGS